MYLFLWCHRFDVVALFLRLSADVLVVVEEVYWFVASVFLGHPALGLDGLMSSCGVRRLSVHCLVKRWTYFDSCLRFNSPVT
jgi:hypothetical protein